MHIPKVRTVSQSELSRRLPEVLRTITNGQLIAKLRRRQPLMKYWSADIEKLIVGLGGQERPYWWTVSEEELDIVYESLLVWCGREVSESFLATQFAGVFHPSHREKASMTQLMRLVSSPWMLEAVVEDRAMANKLCLEYDIELGRRR